MVSCEFCEIFKETFFTEPLQTAASLQYSYFDKSQRYSQDPNYHPRWKAL